MGTADHPCDGLAVLIVEDSARPQTPNRQRAPLSVDQDLEGHRGFVARPAVAHVGTTGDKALVEAIPKVNAAKTPQEYQAAINFLQPNKAKP